jgi:hypothetical protein
VDAAASAGLPVVLCRCVSGRAIEILLRRFVHSSIRVFVRFTGVRLHDEPLSHPRTLPISAGGAVASRIPNGALSCQSKKQCDSTSLLHVREEAFANSRLTERSFRGGNPSMLASDYNTL